MKNTTQKQLKQMSDYTLGERLDGLVDMLAVLNTFRHVFEKDERLNKMIDQEIDDINEELDRRQELREGEEDEQYIW